MKPDKDTWSMRAGGYAGVVMGATYGAAFGGGAPLLLMWALCMPLALYAAWKSVQS